MGYKISIVTICYNDKAGLERTAKSVMTQTYDDFEWIIVDGGSSDGSVEVIKCFADTIEKSGSHIHVSWKSEPDKGIYNAMNKGIYRASGDYLLFLNSGDYLSSPKSLSRVMDRGLHSDIVSCDIFLGRNKKWFPINYAPDRVRYQRIIRGQLPHQSTFISRFIFDKIKYNENYKIFSDVQFWFESLIVMNYSYQHINIPISVFDMTGVSNNSSQLANDERRDFLSRYFDKNIIERVLTDSQWEVNWDNLNSPIGLPRLLRKISFMIRWIYDMIMLRLIILYSNFRYRDCSILGYREEHHMTGDSNKRIKYAVIFNNHTRI